MSSASVTRITAKGLVFIAFENSGAGIPLVLGYDSEIW